jgi:glycosyltransferase involved in cell wall biosynthesis
VPRPQDHTAAVLAENKRHYRNLVAMVEHYAARGDVEHVLRAAVLAAHYAWLAPVGLLSDLRLERLVVQALGGAGRVTVDGDRRKGRVLHVLTEVYATGGHTRLAARWLSRDERVGDVVLTNQFGPVPGLLVDAVRSAGGALTDLRASAGGLLDRARELRRQMDRADLVVMHVHPSDVVAFAAATLPGTRPPVIYENHADLGFWLGVGAADLLCDLRPGARALDVELRGVPGERIAVLPMPVDQLPAAGADLLRAGLGIRPDAVVALTVSDDWKVAPSWGQGMHDLLDRVLSFCPALAVVLVGVAPNESWARLARRYPRRVASVGRVPDPAPYYALADIYLDSHPNWAGTTPLEAAMLGLPVVALADLPDDDRRHIFQSPQPGLAERPVCTTASQFAVTVRRLALDPDLRRREGAEARAAVGAVHDGPGWRTRVEALYEQVRSFPAVDLEELGESPTDDSYGMVLLSSVAAATSSRDPRSLATPLGALFDRTMELDLLAAQLRDEAPSFQVRVAEGWETRPDWISRVLALASAQRRLTVSLPFAAGDDPRGSRSVARLTELLAALGQSPDDCGDIRLESHRGQAAVALNGDLAITEDALERLEQLCTSPCWEDAPVAGPLLPAVAV